MAQLSLGESKWRMVRRVLKKKRFKYADARNMTRVDEEHFDWLVENGFFAQVGDGVYVVTQKGKGAADLGIYEYEPAPVRTVRPPRARRTDSPLLSGSGHTVG